MRNACIIVQQAQQRRDLVHGSNRCPRAPIVGHRPSITNCAGLWWIDCDAQQDRVGAKFGRSRPCRHRHHAPQSKRGAPASSLRRPPLRSDDDDEMQYRTQGNPRMPPRILNLRLLQPINTASHGRATAAPAPAATPGQTAKEAAPRRGGGLPRHPRALRGCRAGTYACMQHLVVVVRDMGSCLCLAVWSERRSGRSEAAQTAHRRHRQPTTNNRPSPTHRTHTYKQAQQRRGKPGQQPGGGGAGDGKAERAAEREEFKRMWKSVMDLGTCWLGFVWIWIFGTRLARWLTPVGALLPSLLILSFGRRGAAHGVREEDVRGAAYRGAGGPGAFVFIMCISTAGWRGLRRFVVGAFVSC